jgi:NadR type nicotinamide-nucleotide adenylyltransferase
LIRVALIGPESTGKSTLAGGLAAHYGTFAVPEYGRIYCEIFGNSCDAEDLRAILRGQLLLEEAGTRKAREILILDTDAVMTAIWSDVLLGTRLAEFDHVPVADLYLIADIDVPFAADAIRYFPGDDDRQRMLAMCKAELERRNLPFVVIRGDRDARLAAAITAIDTRLASTRAQ